MTDLPEPVRLTVDRFLPLAITGEYRDRHRRRGMTLLTYPLPDCPVCTQPIDEMAVSGVLDFCSDIQHLAFRPCGHRAAVGDVVVFEAQNRARVIVDGREDRPADGPSCGEECTEGHVYAGRCALYDPTACVWPDCLTDGQQADLAEQVRRSMLGEPTTAGPDQRQMCGCRGDARTAPDMPNGRARCPRCRLPHDLDGMPAAACRSIMAGLSVDDAVAEARTTPDNLATSSDAADNRLPGLATVTIAVHAPDQPQADRWAQIIADDVRTEQGDQMPLSIRITPDATAPALVTCDGCGDELTHQCVPCGALAAAAEDIIAAANTQAAPLREQLTAAITAALKAGAYSCDGNCGLDEADCIGEHPVQVAAWSHGAVSDVDGPVDAIAALLTPAVLAAVQGQFAPPPPGSTAEQLPAELLALIERAPYLSTACDAAQRLKSAAGREASYIEDRLIDQLAGHAGKLHQRCRLNNKFTGQPCRCACHQETLRG